MLFSTILWLAPVLSPQEASLPKPVLEAPIRLQADGAWIDTGDEIGHSGPLLYDFDGDGALDLLVGTFTGTIRVYRNAGTNAAPRYESAGKVRAEGAEVRIPNW